MTDTERHSGDLVKIANAYFRLVAMSCEISLSFWKTHPPDPKKQPVTSKLVEAYLSRVEIQLAAFQKGSQAALEQSREYPTLHYESHELGLWIGSHEPNSQHSIMTTEREDFMGNLLVEDLGFSYSHARELLRKWATPKKGAPNKRAHTLKMFDARIANGWSYAKLASKMCDCQLATHNELCRERIRKRLKELEGMLSKYGIAYRQKRRK